VRLFLAATSLHPAYGGPAHSVTRLATALADAGVDVGLWASDGSARSTGLLPSDTPVQRFDGAAASALNAFGGADLIHDNGIWLPNNHQLAVLSLKHGIPRVVSTRGMLEPWAVRHKRWKKRLAWYLYQRTDLRHAHLLHTTASSEAANLEQVGLEVAINVIPNGVDVPVLRTNARPVSVAGSRTVLFLGRINPVKGLRMLIEAWSRVRPQDWRLSIVGPDEEGHRLDIERAVAAAKLTDAVSFTGLLEGEAKSAALRGAQLLVLPSRSESFGTVVAEALAHGVPVLTTSRTPWGMIESHGCGWCVEPSTDAIAIGLREATSQSAETLREMGANGRRFVAAEFGWDAIADQFMAAYEKAISANSQPGRRG
jgi:glycosyltransferase involved in cell wall biosynthesis